MKHQLLTIAAVLSVFLIISIVALWARSQWYEEGGHLHALNTKLILHLDEHRVVLHVVPNCPRGSRTQVSKRYRPQKQESRWGEFLKQEWLGFGYGTATFHGQTVANAPSYMIGIPFWFVPATLWIFPVLWFISRPRRRRGLCANCGYDLRASTEQCPECGTPIQSSMGT